MGNTLQEIFKIIKSKYKEATYDECGVLSSIEIRPYLTCYIEDNKIIINNYGNIMKKYNNIDELKKDLNNTDNYK